VLAQQPRLLAPTANAHDAKRLPRDEGEAERGAQHLASSLACRTIDEQHRRHPFTQTTCRSVCSTSTRSVCAAITASVGLYAAGVPRLMRGEVGS
jgi:hypothetical protein